MEKLTYCQD